MKRAIALFLVFVALALVLAGCGGKAKERALTVADLASVIGPAPLFREFVAAALARSRSRAAAGAGVASR